MPYIALWLGQYIHVFIAQLWSYTVKNGVLWYTQSAKIWGVTEHLIANGCTESTFWLVASSKTPCQVFQLPAWVLIIIEPGVKKYFQLYTMINKTFDSKKMNDGLVLVTRLTVMPDCSHGKILCVLAT